jgi:hypothetical protein
MSTMPPLYSQSVRKNAQRYLPKSHGIFFFLTAILDNDFFTTGTVLLEGGSVNFNSSANLTYNISIGVFLVGTGTGTTGLTLYTFFL